MLTEKVLATITKYRMLSKNDKVLVCVSGGPDSVALVYLLYFLRDEFKLKLQIAHLNHMIRGSQADQDAEFVRKLSQRLNLPIISKKKDVPSFVKKNKMSLEEGARLLRYRFFLEAAKKFKADKVAIGHTADDQVETVLMRIIRGTGLEGLGGMQPVSEQNGIKIIRPLIEVWKEEITDYLREKNLRFRMDLSNKDRAYFRNKIRLGLIPHLSRSYNPGIKEIILRFSDAVRQDCDYLEKSSKKAFENLSEAWAKKNKTEVGISIRRLKKYPLAVQRRIMRLAIKKVKGDLQRINFQNLKDLNSLIQGRNRNLFLHLAGGIRARRDYDKLIFYSSSRQKKIKKFKYRLKTPGITIIPETGLKLKTISMPGRKGLIKKKTKNNNIKLFDYDKLKFPLLARNRFPGDRIRPLGMKGEKKLKDIFIDQKIPLPQRDSTPVIVSADKRIVWVVGAKTSDEFKLTSKTKRVLKIILSS
jgi:tRNA(Ile)-lysidine synthase